tara:strand:+ start:1959 stop:3641 length:1683 start_codon:yes stop_codon:yes gene_type:complete
MCGIFVSYGPDVNFLKNKELTNMLYHRGPDNQENHKIDDELIFGHTRLSIIDLNKTSNQPFRDGYSVILFNGMIYNFMEIKKQLKSKYNFKTNSDTEVISAAYKNWGESCFEHLNGMFSIVIYDIKKKKIIIARDRLGIKPLYFRKIKKNYYFSSEIKPLLKLASYSQNLNTVYNYFKYSFYENKNDTFFKEIKQILPGHYYTLKNNKFTSIKNYWKLEDKLKATRKIFSINEAKEIFKEEFERIKKYYIRSDKEIGLLYSSGLDSNFILNLFNQEKNNISLLLTFGFKAKNIEDEIGYLQNNSIKNFNYKFSIDELLTNAQNVQLEQEMPWGGPNVFFQGALLQKAKKLDHRVVLSADGADEIFGGYDKYLNINKISSNYINQAIDGTVPFNKSLFKNEFFFKKKIDLKLPFNNKFDNARYLDISFSKLPRNFRFSDRYSMNKSVELRYPFLDHILIENSFRLEKRLMINKTENKIMLRKFFNNKTKKRHINSPQTQWFYETKLKKIMSNISKESPIFDIVLDKKKTKNYFDYFYKKKRNNSFKMWQIYNYDLWLKTFF